jgi:hypothetical protein
MVAKILISKSKDRLFPGISDVKETREKLELFNQIELNLY